MLFVDDWWLAPSLTGIYLLVPSPAHLLEKTPRTNVRPEGTVPDSEEKVKAWLTNHQVTLNLNVPLQVLQV